MAQESFNAQEAEQALKKALTENDDLISKFNETNQKVANAFTNSGDAVKGRLGEAAANCWGDGSGDFFTKNLSVKTEDFLTRRVNEILQTMDQFTSSVESAYSSTAQNNGTSNM
mgnify:CR=1 FL=1|jgi:hypothetical protein